MESHFAFATIIVIEHGNAVGIEFSPADIYVPTRHCTTPKKKKKKASWLKLYKLFTLPYQCILMVGFICLVVHLLTMINMICLYIRHQAIFLIWNCTEILISVNITSSNLVNRLSFPIQSNISLCQDIIAVECILVSLKVCVSLLMCIILHEFILFICVSLWTRVLCKILWLSVRMGMTHQSHKPEQMEAQVPV